MPLPLTLPAYGAFVGKKSERVVVKQDGKVVQEVPFFRISEIVLPPRSSVSCELVREACARGIRIAFLADGGRPYALLSSPSQPASVEIRRAQLQALSTETGALLARTFVAGKLRNQAALLKHFAKYLHQAAPERGREVDRCAAIVEEARERAAGVKLAPLAEIRDTLMGIEGAARWTRSTRSSTTATGSSTSACGAR